MVTSGNGSMHPPITAPTHFPKSTDMPSLLEPPSDDDSLPSATKVVCTLGPASRSVERMIELLEAGMTLARVDLTWGSLDYHKQSLRNLSEAMQQTGMLCAVIIDIVGREVLVTMDFEDDEEGWPVSQESIPIKAGQEIRLTPDLDAKMSSEVFPVSYNRFAELCSEEDTFFVGRYLASGADDSSIFMKVVRIEGGDVVCQAQNDSELSGLLTVLHSGDEAGSGGGLNLTDLPLLSDTDVAALKSLAEEGVEFHFLALTFTRSGADVREARKLLADLGLSHVKILAKVEDASALHEFDSISGEADGLVLSRGNLGLDIAPEKMARVQKAFIAACNLLGKPVIMTRILDTMTFSPRPTRAEATDVANAVLDGVDAVMLGAETLRGKFPVETVAQTVSICRQAEQEYDNFAHYENLSNIATRAQEEQTAEADRTLADSHSNSEASFQLADGGGRGGGGGGAPFTTFEALQHSMASQRNLRGEAEMSYRNIQVLAREEMNRMYRLEFVAAAAVRTAEKVQAGLIIVLSHSGRTAALVAKYRPAMPIIALVIPRVICRDHKWVLTGLASARQTLVNRGVVPLLGAPMFGGSSETLLQQAIDAAASRGLVKPHQSVVCVLSLKSDLVVEILPVSPGAKVPGDDVASLPNSHGLEEPTSAPTLAAPARPMTSPPKTPPADMAARRSLGRSVSQRRSLDISVLACSDALHGPSAQEHLESHREALPEERKNEDQQKEEWPEQAASEEVESQLAS
mmetsp:Transcript_1064/g.3258  ORF Transcript_1064/g.3258 Transcript_1064/m.3258 type:complete len:747 (+) Transcript_1064:279-2519(+)|eukprot:CAMPEP_0206136696 /NCGR_PEP_ID=MMETSP1473-20131121/1936_1 /ASSEMBLY_ACC=CAM_ASM_001109 /TAXON_ID=1461547 /ORGANISM="Stichococcus sp, Strain RCC1054" /LENGTH=746 /DNA_ID=CAMNT_0053529423 /DNA_START=171 /DNA_END=2411 /DNA_ORIENTATION=+